MSTHDSTTYYCDPYVANSEGSNPKTFRPCDTKTQNEWIVRPPEIVTLQPQKVDHDVIVEHCILLVFFYLNCLRHSVPDSTTLPLHFSMDFRLWAFI